MTHTVVIADDDADIRELVTIAVNRSGLTVVAVAEDGAQALEAIRLHKPDLAILDIAMPEMSGVDVCRAVRADASMGDVRILLLSASVEESAVEVGLSAGADYFFPKPFSPRDLIAWLSVGKQARA